MRIPSLSPAHLGRPAAALRQHPRRAAPQVPTVTAAALAGLARRCPRLRRLGLRGSLGLADAVAGEAVACPALRALDLSALPLARASVAGAVGGLLWGWATHGKANHQPPPQPFCFNV